MLGPKANFGIRGRRFGERRLSCYPSYPPDLSRVWDPETSNCEAVLSGHGGTIGALCTLFSRRPPVASNEARHGRKKENGELLIVSGSGDSTVRVWGRAGDGTSMREWTCRAVLKGHRYGVTALRWLMFSLCARARAAVLVAFIKQADGESF